VPVKKPAVRFALAFFITLASAVWQRLSGPTYPVRGHVVLGGKEISLKLDRSHAGPGDQPVWVKAPDTAVTGMLAYRRYPTSDPWSFVVMPRQGDDLVGALPHQPPAGKVEFQVRLVRGQETVLFPPRPVIARFKGEVPASLLVPHVAAMFLGMLLSTATGFAALVRDVRLRWLTLLTLLLIVVGGLVLGPLVQKAAFGSYWTGIPFGIDLTDNKTLLATLFWIVAALRQRGGREARLAVVIAALATLAVFAIPHSTLGSEIRWETAVKPG
jgi:hypothetical protein